MNHSLPGLEAFSTQTIRDRIRAAGRRSAPEPEFPVEVDPELVAELVKRFPNECPEPGAAPDAVAKIQGQQMVIRLLARASIDQHPNDLGGK